MTTKNLIDELKHLDPEGKRTVRLDDIGKPLIYFAEPDAEGNILLSADVNENFNGIF